MLARDAGFLLYSRLWGTIQSFNCRNQEMALRHYLPHCLGPDYSNLAIYNHSDLLRAGNYPERIARLKEMADVILIDEAHHFRNPGIKGKEGEQRKSHYWQGRTARMQSSSVTGIVPMIVPFPVPMHLRHLAATRASA
jgi:hypothetical protein